MSDSNTPISRGRDIHESHRVSTPLELLFDLTFVVAIAQASSQLHHAVMSHHTMQALPGFMLAFAAIWWAWMNYTWFASAYDNDDTLFRVLTMVQMGGVLLLATGIPGLFAGQFLAGVMGYVVMRLALCVQWLRAARGDPPRRKTCLRYATGIVVVQLAWIGFLVAANSGWLVGVSMWGAIFFLWLCELATPVWAERAGGTPWHAHHIAERFGLLFIIVLGECVLGATNAVANMWQVQGWTFDLALLGFGSTLLIFCMWWMYFLLPSADALHHHRKRAWGWGYGHYFLFAAVTAVGSGLEVVADALKDTHGGMQVGVEMVGHHVSSLEAISIVALAEGVSVFALWALHSYATRAHDKQRLLMLIVLGCIAMGPMAVAQGLPLPWGLLMLSLGLLIAIVYNEYGRRRCADQFSVR